MEDWKETNLGNEIGVLTDYTANGSFESLKQNVQYYNDLDHAALVRTTDLGKSIFKPERYTDKKGYSFLKTVHLFGGEIVIANVGSLGKAYRVPYYPMFMVLAPNMYLLKFKETIDEDYIFQYLISSNFKDSLLKVIGSTTLQAVNKDNLRSIKFKLPKEKSEQTRIAEILSTADEAIAHTEALIAKYQRIKTGLMQDLLTRGIDENGTIRSKETHKFKESKLGKIPVEWDVVTVGSLCKEIVVGIVVKPTQYYIESGVPMLRSFNIKEGAIEMRDLVYMSNLDNERLSKSKLKEGDVVSVRTGYPGTTAIITKEIEGCNCIDLVISRVNSALLNPNFLVTWINSHLAKRQILNHQGGNAQQHFNVGQMKELLIYKIPLEEQNRILNLVKIEDDKTINSKLHLSKLQSLKNGLMQDLLSGKVRVKIDKELETNN